MQLELKNLDHIPFLVPQNVTIREMLTPQEREEWSSVLSKVFPVMYSEVVPYLDYIYQAFSLPRQVRLYCAFYEGKPVATRMLICHGDICVLQRVAVLPEYKSRGIGFAVSYHPLLEAKAEGLRESLLIASTQGKPIYKKMGFQECGVFKVLVNL